MVSVGEKLVVSWLVDRLVGKGQEVHSNTPQIVLNKAITKQEDKIHQSHSCKGTGSFCHEREENGWNLGGEISDIIKDQTSKLLSLISNS